MKRLYVLTMFAAVVAILPDAVTAQAKQRTTTQRTTTRSYSSNDCCYQNRFTLDPYAGGMKDAYDIGASDDLGYLVGFRVGYQLGSRTRLLGNVGYSNTENVADPQGLSSYFIYDNVWVITTGGAEFDVVPGRTAASLGVQVGAGWRKLDLEGRVGEPTTTPMDDQNFTAYEVVVPSLTLRHWLTSRAAVIASFQDHMFNLLDGPTQHSPALMFGVSFR